MSSEKPLWDYIPLSAYRAPVAAVTEATRATVVRFLDQLRPYHRKADVGESDGEQKWAPAADEPIRQATPPADWGGAAAALEAKLGDWWEEPEPNVPVRVIVGPAGAGPAAVVADLAHARGMTILEPPATDTLGPFFTGDDVPCHDVPPDDREPPLAITHLERFYLRHEAGLGVMRHLVDSITKQHRKVLIACDSWAWAYLEHVLGVEQTLGEPLVLAPFDGAKLDVWLAAACIERQIDVRMDGADQSIFSAAEKRSSNSPAPALVGLANNSRGIPGVAREIWRRSLRRQVAEETTSEAVPAPENACDRRTLWMAPLAELTLPAIPANADGKHLVILHTALLHGGVSRSLLALLLPFPRDETLRRIRALEAAGLLHDDGERICVPPVGYPAARRALVEHGYLVDGC